ncbi:transcriptional regulator, GntR family with LacI sensor [Candidatus Vecturithrix granuli]|uniref:Transcriptional regulator, GntR family with LacI sensor n=1 Tax=Vecturithrix granuli TaxID=1499967 RepID=A0A0S6WAI0_VECG1|nr:transcriptional regulator, GntR family with LacI sensor [Candidatus Vecturithrix granuli]
MDTLKYKRLKLVIKNNIRDGIWKSGEKVPSERSLCEQFGISKITVKKAKDDLLIEGLLENLPGRKGVFVKRACRTPSKGLVGVAIDDVNDPHFAPILKGIEDKLWENKLHTILCNASHDVEKVEAYFRSLVQQQVAGVIFTPSRGPDYIENNRRILNMLTEHQIPYVLVDRYIQGLCSNAVVSNNHQGSQDLTTHLLERGHKRILLVTGEDCSSIADRLQGYLQALRNAGISPDPCLIIQAQELLLEERNARRQQELERLRALVQQAGDFSACYTLNSLLLKVALQIIFPKEPSTKQPIAIASYDYGLPEVIRLTNRVIVVKQPSYRMGWEAARLLVETLNNPDLPVMQITLKSDIVEEVIE